MSDPIHQLLQAFRAQLREAHPEQSVVLATASGGEDRCRYVMDAQASDLAAIAFTLLARAVQMADPENPTGGYLAALAGHDAMSNFLVREPAILSREVNHG